LRRILLITAILTGIISDLFATHNRAGEITYEQISQFYYKVTITTYTKTSSPADRPELDIYWGDGTMSTLPRASFQDNFGGPGSDIRKNVYFGFHTYPGPSVYTIYFEDPNRNGGVVNIPNSINVPFYVETQLIISAALGFNNSPVLLQPPIDEGVIGQVFIHNANAYDPDGDSLSYELFICRGADGLPIPGYSYPAASNSFTLDPVTGDLIWDSPVGCGEYNVAFLIREWRNGFNIGYVERDMQINILCNNPNNNQPPVISDINDTCVTAGDYFNFTVTANDPDPGDVVTLTATGSPLTVTVSPAQFNQPVSGSQSVSQLFEWQTDCDHVRRQPYQMVFRAVDDDPFVSLADLESVRITIVAPAPQNPSATPQGNGIQLNWDQSICQQATGYKVYRRAGFTGFTPANCETGVPAYTGYKEIATINGVTNNSYYDDDNGAGLAPATDYCYMIIAYFDDGAESYASAEVCATLQKDLPVMTNVSIEVTNPNNGEVYTAWSKPIDLDSAQYPPPYEYRLLRSGGINTNSFVQVSTFNDLNDTTYTDTGLNTVDDGFTYRVDLYATVSGNLQFVGSSQPASSIFLQITPTDERLNLSWDLVVPWTNDTFNIYRFDGSVWNQIGFSLIPEYADTGLVNGNTYCYYVESVGDYDGTSYASPLLNNSQELCAIPVDNVPPCPIGLDTTDFDCLAGVVTFIWDIPDPECGDDIEFYSIYFSPSIGQPFEVLTTITDLNQNSYTYNNGTTIAGCFYITATDSTGNESMAGGQVCIDNCPYYELPNVFTPDGNGLNDLYEPFPYRYVKDIDLKIFNRWGQVVFETTDPDIRWNGQSMNGGTDLPDGVYYYKCIVNEIYLNGIVSRQLQPGFIHLLRDRNNFK
jgi:gliding motility-associated-like protein